MKEDFLNKKEKIVAKISSSLLLNRIQISNKSPFIVIKITFNMTPIICGRMINHGQNHTRIRAQTRKFWPTT